jgi:HEAT repeat protein
MNRATPLLLLAALTACATDSATKTKTDAPAAPTQPKDEAKASEDRQLRLSRSLIDIDRQVNEYATLAAETGVDAKSKRDSLGKALSFKVAEFKPELLTFAADASNPIRRYIAVKALGFADKQDDRATLAVLTSALTVKDDVRLLVSATYALGTLGSAHTDPIPLLDLMKDLDPDVRSNALRALARVFQAKRDVGGSPLDSLAQRDAMILLEPMVYDTGYPLVRANAAAAIGALGDPRGVDPLINLLRDPHPLVRTQAAMSLAKLGDLKSAPALVKAIDTAEAGNARRIVVLSLGTLLEKHGHKPPESLGEDFRMWERYVRENVRQAPESPQK